VAASTSHSIKIARPGGNRGKKKYGNYGKKNMVTMEKFGGNSGQKNKTTEKHTRQP